MAYFCVVGKCEGASLGFENSAANNDRSVPEMCIDFTAVTEHRSLIESDVHSQMGAKCPGRDTRSRILQRFIEVIEITAFVPIQILMRVCIQATHSRGFPPFANSVQIGTQRVQRLSTGHLNQQFWTADRCYRRRRFDR